MAYEMKEGQGSLFHNKKKKETQPDFRGTGMINGQVYEISGWNKTAKTGTQFVSLSIKPKQEQSAGNAWSEEPSTTPETTPSTKSSNDMDDDIPF